MKKRIILPLLLTLVAVLSSSVNAQVTETEKTLRAQVADTTQGWKTGGMFSVNMAQNALVNWAAGGQNSFAVNSLLTAFANYTKGNSRWDNTLDLGYGLLKQGDDQYYRKTDDKIDFLSKYGQKAFKNFYYAGLLNFKTQFRDGFNYVNETTYNKISDFFAPAYLQLAIGLDYKPNAYFSAFLAPISGKFTFVLDEELSDLGAFGVEPGKSSKSEMGGYFRAIYSKNDFKSEIMKNVGFTTKLDLFSNYLDNPQNVDVSWEVLIGLKINKFLTANLNTHLIYDDNILVPVDLNDDGTVDAGEQGKRIQFKEIFGLGLSFKF